MPFIADLQEPEKNEQERNEEAARKEALAGKREQSVERLRAEGKEIKKEGLVE